MLFLAVRFQKRIMIGLSRNAILHFLADKSVRSKKNLNEVVVFLQLIFQQVFVVLSLEIMEAFQKW